MKSIILIIFLYGTITMSCFSQIKYDLNFDSSALTLKLTAPANSLKTYDLRTANQKEQELNLVNCVKKQNLENEKNYNSERKVLNEEQTSIDRMPCIKPEIQSAMPIFEPDSTINFTLLIKKLK